MHVFYLHLNNIQFKKCPLKNKMKTILITGARAPIALEFARSFKTLGYKVIMADSLYFPISRWSNCVDRYYKIPSPVFQSGEFILHINEIIEKEKIDYIIPTSEESIHLSAYRKEIHCKIWVSDLSTTLSLHNKLDFYKFYKDKLPIPPTQKLASFKDWGTSIEYVFKPIHSRFASAVVLNKTLTFNDWEKEDFELYIAQKKILGKEICLYSIWEKGVCKAITAYHPKYRAGKGAGIFFEPVHHEPCFELVENLGKELHYNGQLSFDIIIDKENKPWFIECNPRGTSGAHLFSKKLGKAFEKNNETIQSNNQEIALKNILLFTKPNLLLKSNFWKAKDAIFDRTDLTPSLLQFISLIEICAIALKNKTSILKASTRDIEWNNKSE